MKYILPRHIFISGFVVALVIVGFNVTPSSLTIENCAAAGAATGSGGADGGCPCKNAPYPPGKAGEIEKKQDQAKCPSCVPIREKWGQGTGDAQSLQSILTSAVAVMNLIKGLTGAGGGGGGEGGGGAGSATSPTYDPYTNPYVETPVYTPDDAITDLYDNLEDTPTDEDDATTDGPDPSDFFTDGEEEGDDGDEDDEKPGDSPQAYYCEEDDEACDEDDKKVAIAPSGGTYGGHIIDAGLNDDQDPDLVTEGVDPNEEGDDIVDSLSEQNGGSKNSYVDANGNIVYFSNSGPVGDDLPEQEFGWTIVEETNDPVTRFWMNLQKRLVYVTPFPLIYWQPGINLRD